MQESSPDDLNLRLRHEFTQYAPQGDSYYLLANREKLRKEVQKTMGGEILELHSEKMLKKGRREGIREGMQKANKAASRC